MYGAHGVHIYTVTFLPEAGDSISFSGEGFLCADVKLSRKLKQSFSHKMKPIFKTAEISMSLLINTSKSKFKNLKNKVRLVVYNDKYLISCKSNNFLF
jgi:hypothetical protein